MSAYTYRLYSGDADFQAIAGLLSAVRPRERVNEFPSLVDLREMLGTAGLQANTALWDNSAGQLAGFSIFDHPNLIFEIAPEADDLGALLIAWGADRLWKAGFTSGEPLALDTSCSDSNIQRIKLLEQHNFERLAECGLHYARPLNGPIPEPPLPAGYTIRPLAGEQEVEAWVTLHRAAWGTENMTVEYRLSMMHMPGYDPALDLVAVAPDGSLTAYCVCYISHEENTLNGRIDGYTDPIATHPAHQRRGLARALVLTGLNLLQQRGVETVHTGTGSDNRAMQQLAESVRFQLTSRTLWFSKSIRSPLQ